MERVICVRTCSTSSSYFSLLLLYIHWFDCIYILCKGVSHEKTSPSKYSTFYGRSNFTSASMHCNRVSTTVCPELHLYPLIYCAIFHKILILAFCINLCFVQFSGSLFRLLQRNTSKPDWRRRVHMALDIVSALKLNYGQNLINRYIHSYGADAYTF
jgi:hypothetical protein